MCIPISPYVVCSKCGITTDEWALVFKDKLPAFYCFDCDDALNAEKRKENENERN